MGNASKKQRKPIEREECKTTQLKDEEYNYTTQLKDEECNETTRLKDEECNETTRLKDEECNETTQLKDEIKHFTRLIDDMGFIIVYDIYHDTNNELYKSIGYAAYSSDKSVSPIIIKFIKQSKNKQVIIYNILKDALLAIRFHIRYIPMPVDVIPASFITEYYTHLKCGNATCFDYSRFMKPEDLSSKNKRHIIHAFGYEISIHSEDVSKHMLNIAIYNWNRDVPIILFPYDIKCDNENHYMNICVIVLNRILTELRIDTYANEITVGFAMEFTRNQNQLRDTDVNESEEGGQ